MDGAGGRTTAARSNPAQGLSLVTLMTFVLALGFEFPVVLVALELAKIFTPRQRQRGWRRAVVTIAVASAVLTAILSADRDSSPMLPSSFH